MSNWRDLPPTEAQIGALYSMVRWHSIVSECEPRIQWLRKGRATRGEVSDELERVRALYVRHMLDNDNAFASVMWKRYLIETA